MHAPEARANLRPRRTGWPAARKQPRYA